MNPIPGTYRITAAAGILLSAALFLHTARKNGLPLSRAAMGWAAGLLSALILSKAVYVLFSLPALEQYGPGKWFRAVPEEFSFAAGGIGFCLGFAAAWPRRREVLPRALDLAVLPGCVLAAALRFGGIWLGELELADMYSLGLSEIREGSLFARFPFAVPDAWGYWYLSVSTLSAFLILCVGCHGLFLLRKKQDHASEFSEGMVFERSAFLLCAIRFFLELTRMKSFIFYFVHVDQVLCALVMLGLTVRGCLRFREKAGRFPVLCPVLLLFCIAVNGVTQYLMDKPWQFESLMSESVFTWVNENLAVFGYALLLLTSVLPAVLFLLLQRKIRRAPRGTE